MHAVVKQKGCKCQISKIKNNCEMWKWFKLHKRSLSMNKKYWQEENQSWKRMSAIIDDKVVAGAKDPNVVKEDPILILSASNPLTNYENLLSWLYLCTQIH